MTPSNSCAPLSSSYAALGPSSLPSPSWPSSSLPASNDYADGLSPGLHAAKFVSVNPFTLQHFVSSQTLFSWGSLLFVLKFIIYEGVSCAGLRSTSAALPAPPACAVKNSSATARVRRTQRFSSGAATALRSAGFIIHYNAGTAKTSCEPALRTAASHCCVRAQTQEL